MGRMQFMRQEHRVAFPSSRESMFQRPNPFPKRENMSLNQQQSFDELTLKEVYGKLSTLPQMTLGDLKKIEFAANKEPAKWTCGEVHAFYQIAFQYLGVRTREGGKKH
jgi:hypothetical protein